MLVTFEDVVADLDVTAADLEVWIERNWVLPVIEKDRYFFDQTDVARVRLIVELHQDLGVNDEAMPVVLRLLDQIYGLRKALSDLNGAIKDLPAPCRRELKQKLRSLS